MKDLKEITIDGVTYTFSEEKSVFGDYINKMKEKNKEDFERELLEIRAENLGMKKR